MDKTVKSSDEAVRDINDGAIILSAGFGLCGIPENLIRALVRKGSKDLTIICNNLGSTDSKDGQIYGAGLLAKNGQIKKFIGSFPGPIAKLPWFKELYRSKKIELEIIPQGTLNERIRCAGAGLGGFYTPTGVGTPIEEGKEKRLIDGREYILELPLAADFALIKAHKGDRAGNLVYRYSARNYNPVMAPAAKVAIAEVEELCEVGALDPDSVHTPGIFVSRIVKGETYEKRA
ncbi:MAG: 3-oxoacid CoA-transferase subunit A [Elusimicrobia bacterium]|nr:3-oxoacid CoA-transferase subunit A [Elusimicrobiota bacterium]